MILRVAVAIVQGTTMPRSISRIVQKNAGSAENSSVSASCLALPMIASAFAFYPTVVQLAREAKERFVEARYAPQVLNLRQPFVAQIWDGLNRLLEPVYSRIRQFLPATAGLDLAPLVAFIGLIAIRIILQNNAALFY